MKIKYIFVFIIFILFPLNITLAGTPYIVSEFIYEQNILGRIINFEGKILNTFWISSLDQSSGVDIVCGDIDGDDKDEIVVSSKSGLSKIKIYSQDGKVKYKEFLVYDKSYSGGVNIALGDVNIDGMDEIIVSPKVGNNPVKVYNYEGKYLNISFYPFTSQYHGSVNLAVGDVTGDGYSEIITSTGEGIRSEIKVFNNEGDLLPIQYAPFISEYLGGADISSGDIEGDGTDEIVTCQSGGSLCKIYKYNKNQTIVNEWQVFKNNSGVKVSIKDIDGNGEREIITSTKDAINQKIRIYQGTKEMVNEINIYNSSIGNMDFDIFFDSKKDIAKVTYVDDGDTIYLNDGREVRYIGVDTPEIGEDFYIEATNRNKELLYEKEITLEYDRQKIDPYGRLLAYVYSGDEFINIKLLEEGLAKVKTFPPNEKYLDLLKEKEKEAKDRKVGIWEKESRGEGKFNFWDLLDIFRIFF